MNQKVITKQDLSEWKQDPVTIAWFHGIKLKAKELKEGMAIGQTIDVDSADGTAIKTAKMVGQIQGLYDAILINEEEITIED